jgi:guanylate kinase
MLITITGPSGAGKSTLVDAVLEADPNTELAVSVTTRPPRKGEVDGRDYHFLSREDAADLQTRGQFVERVEYHGNVYGYLKSTFEEPLQRGKDLFAIIERHGMTQVRAYFKEAYPEIPIYSILILPPSLEVLRDRLSSRNPEEIERRLQTAKEECFETWEDFDLILINDDLPVNQVLCFMDMVNAKLEWEAGK